MSESVHAPVTQPNLTRKFPLTDMPTGLMAALVTRLADHLLIRRVVRRTGRSRTRAGRRWSANAQVAMTQLR